MVAKVSLTRYRLLGNNKILVVFFQHNFRAYLPGTGSTVIKQAVSPGRGLSIALRLG